MKEKEIKVLNAADYKFTEFAESLGNLSQHESTNWFTKLRELDAKIHTDNLVDKITFTDDRLVLIGFKLLVETNFQNNAGLREWYIVKRYLDVFGEMDVPNLVDLKTFVNLYIGYKFEKIQVNEDEMEQFKKEASLLNKIPYDFLPLFVLNAFASESGEEANEEKVQEEWEGLRDLAKMMIKDTSGAEKSEWKSLLDLSKMMLNNN